MNGLNDFDNVRVKKLRCLYVKKLLSIKKVVLSPRFELTQKYFLPIVMKVIFKGYSTA